MVCRRFVRQSQGRRRLRELQAGATQTRHWACCCNHVRTKLVVEGRMRITCLILGLLVLQYQEVKAWGAEGHSIVAEIAQRNLSPTARARIAELFPNGASAASLSFWADDI